MAGNPVPEETPKFGWKATVAALVFALSVLGGFGVATAIAVDGADDHGEEHSEETEDHSEDEGHSDQG